MHQFPSNGLLRKSRSIFPDFIGCKDTHFSQMPQAFSYFSSFAIKIDSVILSTFCQNAQNEVISRITFFANDFTTTIVSISQRSQCYDLLNHSDFHRLLLLNWRNIFYASIAFCAERIDVYPILLSDYQFCQSFAHGKVEKRALYGPSFLTTSFASRLHIL